MTYFYQHLGLGDHLICNGLVREFDKHDSLVVLVKPHNLKSVKLMFSDLKNVCVLVVLDDSHATLFCDALEKDGFKIIRNGMHSCTDTTTKHHDT